MTDPKSASIAQDNAPARAADPSPVPSAVKSAAPEQQWQLALAHFRAGNAASITLRALLFVAALGLLALIFSMLRPGLNGLPQWAHGLALLFCIGALASIVKGFRLQSEQSMQRFRLIRDGHLEGLAQHDGVVEQLRGRQSAYWDRVAVWALLAALLIEIVARVVSSPAMVNV